MRKMKIFILTLLLLVLADIVSAIALPPLCNPDDPVPAIKLAIKQYVEYAPNAPFSKEEVKGMIREYILGSFDSVCSIFDGASIGSSQPSNCILDTINYSNGQCHPTEPKICLDGGWIEDSRLCCYESSATVPGWVDNNSVFPGCECYKTEASESICDDSLDNDCDGMIDSADINCPMLISTCQELQSMKNDLSGEYTLVSDIDCSETVNWNGGKGFIPVGNNTNKFTGKFNGNNHVISGLYINKYSYGDDYAGLFGYISNAEIKNVGLTNVNIKAGGHVGALTGDNDGTTNIYNSYATGHVECISIYCGGIIGVNRGYIINSSSSIDVSGYFSGGSFLGVELGGIAGINFGEIRNSFATGDINGKNEVGGLVGFSPGKIYDSYATGNVVGEYKVGGLVGDLSLTSILVRSYSTGSVTGNKLTGGLVGLHYGRSEISNTFTTSSIICGSGAECGAGAIAGNCTKLSISFIPKIINCYWYNSPNDYSNSCYTGDTPDPYSCTEESDINYFKGSVAAKEPFTTWDFVNVWVEGEGYPTLR